ncbi:MAG: nucleoside triphosphate pyrophosphohydrolase [Candidatus Eisenbacteria bacterium]|uniref:Nucleoside triphosphate pyrophosphohydrolase n=1 Tax=Eiseniibacteriota bacterium TaxID=2212470 RepID=A0A7Y2E7Y7_UNCEI|nr:nucleoside triphosphate pyrophosphohydrolase [Candidatus Eisenbacteria bacterium]
MMQDSNPPQEKEHRIRSQAHPLLKVLEMVRVLRAPDGCPWDREQTPKSLTPYLQEEVFEVIESLQSQDAEGFQEELGDLLFLVLFVGEASEDQNLGSLEKVCNRVVEKLISRHPHVFASTEELGESGAIRQWEEIKQKEKEVDGAEPPSSLGERPKGLPALTTAFRISEKAGAVGFQWPTTDQAWEKVKEEHEELEQALKENNRERIEEEIGDLLYSVANLARYLQVDPEASLRATTRKFMNRFFYVEKKLRDLGKTPSQSELSEMSVLWEEAKSALKED